MFINNEGVLSYIKRRLTLPLYAAQTSLSASRRRLNFIYDAEMIFCATKDETEFV